MNGTRWLAIAAELAATPADPLVIVPCGAQKAATARPAGELYTSGYHRLALRAAHTLAAPENIRIISAKHGLLPLDKVIDPYDLRLGQPGSITVDHLEAQADEQGLLGHPDVTVLAGRDYTRLVLATWPHARTPLAGARGIGDHQHRLAQLAVS